MKSVLKVYIWYILCLCTKFCGILVITVVITDETFNFIHQHQILKYVNATLAQLIHEVETYA